MDSQLPAGAQHPEFGGPPIAVETSVCPAGAIPLRTQNNSQGACDMAVISFILSTTSRQ
jgi:hypothetical protein